MKKSNIILTLIITISLLTIFFVIIEARWAVDKWLENVTQHEEEQETVTLKNDIKSIVVKGYSKVKMEMNSDKNWITDSKPFGFNYSEDILTIHKELDKETKGLRINIINQTIEPKARKYMKDIELGLTSFRHLEIYDQAMVLVKSPTKLDEIFLVAGQSAKLNMQDVIAKKVHIQCKNMATITIKNLQCDSLFIMTDNYAGLRIYNNHSNIKYASGKIEKHSSVKMPTPKKLAIDTDEEARLKMY